MPLHDLTGHRFGLLIVTSRAPNSPRGGVRWDCQCDCGGTNTVAAGDLRNGKIRSCGCLNTKRGRTLRGAVERSPIYQVRSAITERNRREYNSWASMRSRCGNSNDVKFHLYGGRGITVCDRWISFEAFLADMGPRPSGTSLDRIDPNGHYCPGNCQWGKTTDQQKNRRHTVFLEQSDGSKIAFSEFAKGNGVSPRALMWHLKAGHDLQKCVKALKQKTSYHIKRGSCS